MKELWTLHYKELFILTGIIIPMFGIVYDNTLLQIILIGIFFGIIYSIIFLLHYIIKKHESRR